MGMRYTWKVTPITDGATWGARWETAETAEQGGPIVSGEVGLEYATSAIARGHAAMWIARYEDALAHSEPPIETAAWYPTPDDLDEALAAHRAQFGSGDVQLGGA